MMEASVDTLSMMDTLQLALSTAKGPGNIILEMLFERILPGILTAVIAAWLSVKLALRKYRTEKYWEMRLEGYNNIIMALDKKLSYLHAHLRETENHQDMKDEDRDKYRTAFKEGDEGIERAKRVGKIFLSKQARALVNDIKPRLNKAAEGIDWGDVYGMMDAHAFEYKKIIDNLINITKDDLGLKEL